MRNVIFQSTGLLHKKEDFLLELQRQYTKMAFFAHGGIFKSVVYVHMINETLTQKFHPYSISIRLLMVEWLTY